MWYIDTTLRPRATTVVDSRWRARPGVVGGGCGRLAGAGGDNLRACMSIRLSRPGRSLVSRLSAGPRPETTNVECSCSLVPYSHRNLQIYLQR